LYTSASHFHFEMLEESFEPVGEEIDGVAEEEAD
jgi:hypothetical protein